jgi:hypothetical protein
LPFWPRDEVDVAAQKPHPVEGLMGDMARKYTMSSERRVHDRHLLPGMAPLMGSGPCTAATPAAG